MSNGYRTLTHGRILTVPLPGPVLCPRPDTRSREPLPDERDMANCYRTLSQHLNDLKKENFSLKLRIYFLEERIQGKYVESSDDVYRTVSTALYPVLPHAQYSPLPCLSLPHGQYSPLPCLSITLLTRRLFMLKLVDCADTHTHTQL